MKKIVAVPVMAVLGLLLVGFTSGGPGARKEPQRVAVPQGLSGVRADADFGKMPLYFIPNQGQVDKPVAYYVQGKDKALYFTSSGITFALTSPAPTKVLSSKSERLRSIRDLGVDRFTDPTTAPNPGNSDAPSAAQSGAERWIVKLDFVGANPDVRPVGQDETGTMISYFKGTPKDWKSGLPTYSKIVYPNLWPGIDLVYYGTTNKLKYEFVVHPGADPSVIRLAYRGAEGVAVERDGRLKVRTPAGDFSDDVPIAYQERDGQKIGVKLAYEMENQGSKEVGTDRLTNSATLDDEIKAAFSDGAENRTNAGPTSRHEAHGDLAIGPCEYGFQVGDYDPALPLVLDPAILVYCGYVGGTSYDTGEGIAVDASGNVYVTGSTNSNETTFPVTAGPDLTHNGSSDIFVAKVNAAGTALVYCGYIGGSSAESGFGIAVDGSGNAYVTGYTESSEATFPVKVGPDLTHNISQDVFVAKVNAAGTDLVYCGYIGGWMPDIGYSIAVDGSGNAYVAGLTESNETTLPFPVTVGPDLTFNGAFGDDDGFVAKVNAAGTALVYCGYIGGTGQESCSGIAVDGAGNAYVTGYTHSTEATFPVTVGPDLTYNGDPYFVIPFVAKVNAAGTALAYCGYIGSGGGGSGIAVDASGSAYVTGTTYANQTTFPVSVGPDLTYNGGNDTFVAKLNAAGTSLLYCGYIGGSSDDYGLGIAVNAAGNAYVAGETRSTEGTFPVKAGPDLTYNGGDDAFIAKVNPAGTELTYCGYIGGSGEDKCRSVAVDGAGNAFVTGYTGSSQTTFPVTIGPELVFDGGIYDAFVAKVYYYEDHIQKHVAGDFDGDGKDEIAVDFGATGAWMWDNGVWTQLTASNPEAMIAADVDADNVDEIIADLGAAGLWLWNAGAWTQLSAVNVETVAAGDVDADGSDEVVGDFGSAGLWLWNGGAWTQLSGVNAENITIADVNGSGGAEIVGDFGPTGLWLWNAGAWTQLSGVNVDYVAAGNTDGAGGKDVVGDFGPVGLWIWSSGAWTQLSGVNADYMITADVDQSGDDEIYGDFGPIGLWLWDSGAWTILSGVNADNMIAADTDGDGAAELAVDFGSLGLWLNDGAAWTQLSGVNPENLLAADADGDGADEIFADFGTLGLWMWNGGAWSQISGVNAD
jgi:hypothetical protein